MARKTPHVDKLAREGMYFTRAYTAAPVCSPSRASILTGKYPAVVGVAQNLTYRLSKKKAKSGHRFHVSKWNLPLKDITVAEAMKGFGYATSFIGKWHLGKTEEYYPEEHGFDTNIAGYFKGHPKSYFSPYKNKYLADGPRGEFLNDRLTDEAINLMKTYKKKGNKPFFMYLSYYTVHSPIVVADQKVYKKLKAKKNIINPKYASMVMRMDYNVGRIMKALRRMRIDKNTVLFFYSDNGGTMVAYKEYKDQRLKNKSLKPLPPDYKAPYRGHKGLLYEGGVKAPFIIRYPSMVKAGGITSELMSSPDIYPTLVELASGKADIPKGHFTDGISLVPLMKDANAKLPDRDLHWYFPHRGKKKVLGQKSIIRGDYKLIVTSLIRDNKTSTELYNLMKDIGERTNLSSSMPEKLTELKTALDIWQNVNGLSTNFEAGYPIYPVKR